MSEPAAERHDPGERRQPLGEPAAERHDQGERRRQ
jgi:hypothetical protein